jgi:tRNA nucleotidyltransferase (CCA-adding enzyme)
LAVDLHPDRFGEVIDLFGGVADIGDRTLRVLHSLSFVEDPTRILRAVRFEMRLGFRIEEHTLALVPDAVGLIRRVSGARLLAELVQLMVEPDPVVGLECLAELGVLEQIQPGLVPGSGSREALAALDDAWRRWRSMLPAGRLGARPTARERIAAWLAPQGDVGVRTAERLRMRAQDQAAIRAAARLLAEPGPVADSDAAPSSVYHALRLVPPSALVLAWACAPSSPIADGLLRYATELASVRTEITGADLLRSGHQPGPEIGRALRSVLDARLDGTVTSRDEELAMAEALLSAAGR